MKRRIVIIDPQVAFCSPQGSLSIAFGLHELGAISGRLALVHSMKFATVNG